MNYVMKILGLMLALLSFSTISFAEIGVGAVMPDLNIAAVDSATPSLKNAAFKGKTTVVNFWATWCEACKIELKEMEEEFAELNKNEKFQFVFVSLDKDAANAVEWVKANLKQSDTWLKRLYHDGQFAAAESIGVSSFPTTYVIGPDAKVAKVHPGFKAGEGSTKAIAALAKELLATK